jgi:PEP-CTERM motif
MKRLSRLAAGLAVAFASTVASAQSVTLNFNDLSSAGGFFEGTTATYQGFDFSSATGTPGSSWAWFPGDSRFVSGAGPANNNNITGDVAGAVPGQYDAFVISSTTPFTFHSAFFSGGCDQAGGCPTPIFLQLEAVDGTSINLGGFDQSVLDAADATFSLPASGGITYNNAHYSNTLLTGIVVWAPSGQFSVDDVVVTPVPEPGTYALMALGLAGVGFMVRRRKQEDIQA